MVSYSTNRSNTLQRLKKRLARMIFAFLTMTYYELDLFHDLNEVCLSLAWLSKANLKDLNLYVIQMACSAIQISTTGILSEDGWIGSTSWHIRSCSNILYLLYFMSQCSGKWFEDECLDQHTRSMNKSMIDICCRIVEHIDVFHILDKYMRYDCFHFSLF